MCADTMHFDPAVYVDVAGYRDVCEVGGVQEAVISAFSMPHLYPFHLCVEQLDLALPVRVSSRFIVCIAFVVCFGADSMKTRARLPGCFPIGECRFHAKPGNHGSTDRIGPRRAGSAGRRHPLLLLTKQIKDVFPLFLICFVYLL